MSRKLTKEQLQEEWRRFFDSTYTQPIEDEDEGKGFDIIAGFSAIFAEVSEASENDTEGMYIDFHSTRTAPPASGEVRATGQIDIDRTPPKLGDVNLVAGDRLDMTHLGTRGETVLVAQIELLNDTTIPEGNTSPVTADVRAVRPGEQANGGPRRSLLFEERNTYAFSGVAVSGNTLTLSDFNEGHENAFVRFTAGSNGSTYPRRITSATSGSIVVDGPALTTGTDAIEIGDANSIGLTAVLNGELSGGHHGELDLLGSERLLPRNPNEVDSSYRYRIQQLPDVVSPNAVFRAVSRILKPLGIGFLIGENRVYDDFIGFFADVDPSDDPAASFPDGTFRLPLGGGLQRRGFFILVERQQTGDFGAPADTNPATSSHPSNAADVMFSDGYAVGFSDALQDMIAAVERARMHGMPWVWSVVDTLP
jgi:hypothetical protein